MDVQKLLKELRELSGESEKTVEALKQGQEEGKMEVLELMNRLQKVIPAWLSFIDITKIGDKDQILMILQDILDGFERKDEVFLIDAILFGMKKNSDYYIEIIEEALN